MKRRAVFLDRDGTINVDKHYLYRWDEFEFMEGVPEAIKGFHDLGYCVIVVTNQSGVARGYYSEDDVKILHEHINECLQKYKTQIDGFYYCPHLQNGKIFQYRKKCRCRKPEKGLFEQAIREWNIDPFNSWTIGDRERDIIPGINMGMKGILLTDSESYTFDYCCRRNLLECYEWIKMNMSPPYSVKLAD